MKGQGLSYENFIKAREARPKIEITPESFEALMIKENGHGVERSTALTFDTPHFEVSEQSSVEILVLLDNIHNIAKATLSTPTLQDSFGKDHASRREFIHSMEERYGDVAHHFFQNNKQKTAYGPSMMDYLVQVTEIMRGESERGIEPTNQEKEIQDLAYSAQARINEAKGNREIQLKIYDETATCYLQLIKVLGAV